MCVCMSPPGHYYFSYYAKRSNLYTNIIVRNLLILIYSFAACIALITFKFIPHTYTVHI